MERIKKFMKDESGIVAVEYIVLTGVIGVALIAALTVMTGAFSGFFSSLSTYIGTLTFG